MPTYQQDVTLDPGQSTVISFPHVAAAVGVHSVSVDGQVGSFEVIAEPADIQVTSITVTPAQLYIGEQVTIQVGVTNFGGMTGTKTITCTVS